MNESPFLQFIRRVAHKKTYLETFVRGNNGDQLILMGTKHVLRKARYVMVEKPQEAEQILFRGSGSMNNIWPGGLIVLERFRREFPNIPLIVGPSTYVFRKSDICSVLNVSNSPLTMFARDKTSEKLMRQIGLPNYVELQVSQDSAFEISDSNFMKDLLTKCQKKHILIAMRKDREGAGGILVKATGTWIPKKVRRPLSWLRDRMVALRSWDTIGEIIKQEDISKRLPRIYRDVSVSVSFEEFIASICNAALIITDRLHVGILGHMLNKRVILLPGCYHKIRGVYELTMSGPGSHTTLFEQAS